MTKDEILKYVDDSFSKKDRIDIIKLANDELGIKICLEEMPNDRSAYIQKYDSNKYKIIINKNHTPERNRFSVAHEIAHYILHKESIDNQLEVGRQDISSLSSTQESEADELAASILMPEKYVEKFLAKLNIEKSCYIDNSDIPNALSKHFNVSFLAAVVRLRNLKYNVAYL